MISLEKPNLYARFRKEGLLQSLCPGVWLGCGIFSCALSHGSSVFSFYCKCQRFALRNHLQCIVENVTPYSLIHSLTHSLTHSLSVSGQRRRELFSDNDRGNVPTAALQNSVEICPQLRELSCKQINKRANGRTNAVDHVISCICSIAIDTTMNVRISYSIVYWILMFLIRFDVHSMTQFPRLLSLSAFRRQAARLLLASVPTRRPNLDFPIVC